MSEKCITNICAFNNDNILNIAMAVDIICIANSIKVSDSANNALIWLDSDDKIPSCAQDCLKKYDNAIIACGFNSLGYVSIQAQSSIAEAWKNKVFTYSVSPCDFGLEAQSDSILKCESLEKSNEIIQDVFDNKIKDGCYNAIIVNSALALYICSVSESIYKGMELAKKTIENGSALKCLKEFQYH